MRPSGVTSVVLVVVASLWALWLGWCHLVGERTALDRAEAVFADARLLIAGPRTPPRRRRDRGDRQRDGRPRKSYPIPRSALAQLISTIGAAKPRAIAVDLLLVDETVPDADAALANACDDEPVGDCGRRAIRSCYQHKPIRLCSPHQQPLLWPARPFEEAAKIGLTNIATESGTPRHLPLLLRTDRGLQPSFALQRRL